MEYKLPDLPPVFAWASCKRPEAIHHQVKDLWMKVYPERVENYIEPLVLLEDAKQYAEQALAPLLAEIERLEDLILELQEQISSLQD